eukprot:11190315-Lingulodinium_polyedra.AAC.1
MLRAGVHYFGLVVEARVSWAGDILNREACGLMVKTSPFCSSSIWSAWPRQIRGCPDSVGGAAECRG